MASGIVWGVQVGLTPELEGGFGLRNRSHHHMSHVPISRGWHFLFCTIHPLCGRVVPPQHLLFLQHMFSIAGLLLHPWFASLDIQAVICPTWPLPFYLCFTAAT